MKEDIFALVPVANELAKSRMHKYQNPADVLFVLSIGNTLGLNAATSLMNVYNVNGIPSLKADLKLALAKQHPEYDGCTIDSNSERCIVKMQRKSKSGKIECITSTFTMQDAITAKLVGKDNWKLYPARMLKARAVSYAVNDLFPDIVFGMLSKEEADDIAPASKPEVIYAEVQEITPTAEPQAQEIPVIEEVPQPLDEIKHAITGMLTKMVENNTDGFADEIRRCNSIRKHLREFENQKDELITVRNCQNYSLLVAYHDHLAAVMRGENAKPTIKQRQDALIEKLTSMQLTLEELECWVCKVQAATRHNALDEVQDWIIKAETINV